MADFVENNSIVYRQAIVIAIVRCAQIALGQAHRRDDLVAVRIELADLSYYLPVGYTTASLKKAVTSVQGRPSKRCLEICPSRP
jgi:hypothetical protein